MMSSEEEADCFGLYSDKLLKKAKRSRQRVDAGEPRNSYSSIPNFSSRPTFLAAGSLYSALFGHQLHQQYAAAAAAATAANPAAVNTMLNELFGRQVKRADAASTPADAMMAVDSASATATANSDAGPPGATVNFDCLNAAAAAAAAAVLRRGGLDPEDGGSPPPGDVAHAHNMLRDILQGRKELFALEQGVKAVSVGGNGPTSPDISNNNNNNNDELKTSDTGNDSINDNVDAGAASDSDVADGPVGASINGIADDDDEPASALDDDLSDAGKQPELMDDDSDPSPCASPGSQPASPSDLNKDDLLDEPNSAKDSSNRTGVTIELKRARVENIVSSMRASPSLPTQVNGCKKRKLYHPQQHDNSAVERYAAGLGIATLMDEDDDDDIEPHEIRQKREEKDLLKNQLRSMQEQLAEMQQKYMQLCTRMDQDMSECQDTEDVTSDLEPDGNSLSLPEKPPSNNPPTTPPKDTTPVASLTPAVVQPVMSPAVSKILTAKAHPPPHHMHPSLPLPPGFNGALSLFQQQVLQEQHNQGPIPPPSHHHHHPHHHPQLPHHALSNAAAAIYLGASHKLYMEEARMAKEAAMAAEHQQHLSQQQHGVTHHLQQSQPPQLPQHPHQQQQQQVLSSHAAQQPPPPRPEHTPPTPTQQQQQQQGTQVQIPPTNNQNTHPHSQTPNPLHPPSTPTPTSQQPPQQQSPPQVPPHSKSVNEFSERLSLLRNSALSHPVSGTDLEGLADVLKTEITSSLSGLIDSIMARFLQQKRYYGKQSEVAAEQLNKDLLLASQLLDRKSPRAKVVDRGSNGSAERMNGPTPLNGMTLPPTAPPRVNGTMYGSLPASVNPNSNNCNGNNNVNVNTSSNNTNASNNNPENNINTMNLQHVRPSPNSALFQPPKPPMSQINSAAAALYSSMAGHPFHIAGGDSREGVPEQNEALSLVVAPKKKRHKVTDTRITPKTVCRILAQDGVTGQPQEAATAAAGKVCGLNGTESPPPPPPPPRAYHPPPPPMLPVSLPTSVAIPNPSLQESQVFSPYSPFYPQQGPPPPPPPPHSSAGSPVMEMRDSSPPLPLSHPLSHPPTSMLHPALLAAAAQHGVPSPDYGSLRSGSVHPTADTADRNSDNSADLPYDGLGPTISFFGYPDIRDSLTPSYSSTLTPMHLRKAKLMFFWVRYPSSAVLKMYFPDIKFNKNNTAQLVKWFSNFREFYYIQMEKYARQAVSEGVKSADDLHVSGDCEIYRVLNLHYNRNNHIEVCGPQVPQNFRYVVEQTLREFFKAIQSGKDTEQSWKKSIYKIISRLDDPVPEYFKSPNFLEQLE
ncbi:homeobox protein prospero isoform X3 [Nilaparvata lugens]|uniref:homeobox protein prospero isoform X3 n=1 Tax=Nilaparvata lugens TaxID=108931 RepID=UPI00193D0A7B|nr:homeobox protein prospero isoform X3 [Nilaparvata lugens]